LVPLPVETTWDAQPGRSNSISDQDSPFTAKKEPEIIQLLSVLL
jgi:hypothetical protein